MTMHIRFWGVRGSCPTPGPETAGVGGNTSCIEVTAGRTRIVLDGGTGLRGLGNELLRQGPVDASVLLSHVHWDHIQGIPFFTPIYVPGTRLHFVAGTHTQTLEQSMRRQMSAPHFPVDLSEVPATISFMEVRDKQRFVLGDAEITAVRANHPDAVYAYRIEHGGRSVVYATDTEHYACVDQRLVALARNADVLIYDAQYLPEEYTGVKGMSRVGWGHSTYEAGVELARAAGVDKLVLFHHDPTRDDDGVRQIEERTRTLFDNACAAREGVRLTVGDTSKSLAA